MTLENRWGDNVEKDGGLLGPDGQPLSSSPKTLKKMLRRPAQNRSWIFLITLPALVFKP